jgi:dTDP-4-amino-4,6-dideoxygalactose transaminase
MTDIQAAIGRAQLKKYRGQLEERFRLAAVYDHAFEKQSNIRTLAREDEKRKGSAHLYIVRLSDANGPLSVSDRNEIMAKMKKKGIATNVHFRPLGDLSVHRERGELLASTPHAASYAEQAISLPLHLNMAEDDVTFVAETLIDLLSRKGMA